MKQIVLLDSKGKKRIVSLTGGPVRLDRFGVLDTSRIDESVLGKTIEIGDSRFLVLEPSLLDRVESINRKAQIILPKDAALIVVNCDVVPGRVVVEGGTGSGALTIVLANFVGPGGRVVSYEPRRDFLEVARANIDRAGMLDRCTLKEGSVVEDISEKNVDAVVLDIPNPWDAIGSALEALKPGGHFASYVPTMNQVERTVKELKKAPFIEVRTLETLERRIEVGEMGTRPSFKMLGHTGYLTFARRVEATFP
ncbi:MAG: tRNA (adenine-N1)-methyltransferase [Thermoplasmata archaeon]